MSSVCLGQGTFGTVFAARRKIDGHRVACKIFAGDHTLDNLSREMWPLQRAQGPHVIKLLAAHGYNADGPAQPGHSVLVFERADGSLLDILERRNDGDDPVKRMVGISAEGALLQLFMAVAHVHERKVVHRDIKPGNILWSLDIEGGRGKLMLADFGAACSTSQATSDCSTEVGTPLYRAPEVWFGGACEAPADVWAVALVACQIIGWKLRTKSGGDTTTAKEWRTDALFLPPRKFEDTSSRSVLLRIVLLLGDVPAAYPAKFVNAGSRRHFESGVIDINKRFAMQGERHELLLQRFGQMTDRLLKGCLQYCRTKWSAARCLAFLKTCTAQHCASTKAEQQCQSSNLSSGDIDMHIDAGVR